MIDTQGLSLPDRMGRRKLLLISQGLQALFSFLTALSPWYWTYMLLRTVQGFVTIGNIFANVILCKLAAIFAFSALRYVRFESFFFFRFQVRRSPAELGWESWGLRTCTRTLQGTSLSALWLGLWTNGDISITLSPSSPCHCWLPGGNWPSQLLQFL